MYVDFTEANAAGRVPAGSPPPEAITDEALIAQIAGGDREAMRALYVRHNVRVHRFVLRLLRNQTAAEDIVSEVFLDVWRQAGSFEGRSAVSTWLLAIARFKALSVLRRKPEDELGEDGGAGISDPTDNPEVSVQKQDTGAILRQCLTALTREHREVIDLVYYHEKSVEEVSRIVGVPQATVKTRMFYARKRLSRLLRSAGVDRPW